MSHRDPTIGRRAYLRGITAAAVGSVGVSTAISPVSAGPDNGAQQTGKFQLENTAEIVREPDERPVNHVVQIDTSSDGNYGSFGRYLEVTDLPEMEGLLSLDANVVSGDTRHDAPRVILSVDTTGNGEHDDWIFGFHQTLGSGIAGQGWTSADFTDSGARWNTRRIGGSGTFISWDQAKSDWSSDFSLRTGWIVDDGFWDDDAAGVLHIDNAQVGNAVLEGQEDTVGGNR